MNVSRKFFGFSDLCCHSGSVSVNLSCPLSLSTKGQGIPAGVEEGEESGLSWLSEYKEH